MFEFEQEIQSLSGELFEIYKDLHMHPERGHTEFRTGKIVADYLRECGLEVQSEVGITGVVGLLDSGKPGKTLLIRADMDCLGIPEESDLPYRSVNEGLAHACAATTLTPPCFWGQLRSFPSIKKLFLERSNLFSSPMRRTT